MKLLIVAMSESIHTARWINQLEEQGWDIHLFPSIDYGVTHPEIKNVTLHHSFYDKEESTRNSSVRVRGYQFFSKNLAALARILLKEYFPNYRSTQLRKLIKQLKPDIIHTLEFQHAAYLTLDATDIFHGSFPPWIVTNWGSDIYLFGRLAEHKEKIRAVLENADYYSCECNRDVKLAKQYGFKGNILPVIPNTGGFDFESVSSLRQSGKVSNRRLIMLKGYQSWAGRALTGLRALERCADILQPYEIAVYSANSNDIRIAAELFSSSTGIPVRIIPKNTPHDEILHLHGQARISIGLSISDAVSTSFIEAIIMGSFPIQSWTSCADEWIEDGKTGILVHPEDADIIEAAIRIALTDNELVDQAAEENLRTCRERLDYDTLKSKAIDLYLTVTQERSIQDVS